MAYKEQYGNGKEASALEEDRLKWISTRTIRQKDPLEGNSLKLLEKLHAARRFCLLLSRAETNEQNRVIKASFVTGDPSFLIVPTLCQYWFLPLCSARSSFQCEGSWPQPDGQTLELFTEIPADHGEAGPDSLAECQNALGALSSIQFTRADFSQSAQLCRGLWNMRLCSLPQVTPCK